MPLLNANEYGRVYDLIRGADSYRNYPELSVFSVLGGANPGRIIVDDVKNPKSAMIRTSETICLAGDPGNKYFNEEIKSEFDFFSFFIHFSNKAFFTSKHIFSYNIGTVVC